MPVHGSLEECSHARTKVHLPPGYREVALHCELLRQLHPPSQPFSAMLGCRSLSMHFAFRFMRRLNFWVILTRNCLQATSTLSWPNFNSPLYIWQVEPESKGSLAKDKLSLVMGISSVSLLARMVVWVELSSLRSCFVVIATSGTFQSYSVEKETKL